jgi:hypothetical protein
VITPTKDYLNEAEFGITISRKKLVQPWIRVFAWIFMITGILSIPILIGSIFGLSNSLALYGLESNDGLSVIGISLTLIYLFKGIAAYGILKRTNWAITIAIIDAILGIIICMAIMLYSAIYLINNFNFRLELVLLIPYLIALIKINKSWAEAQP